MKTDDTETNEESTLGAEGDSVQRLVSLRPMKEAPKNGTPIIVHMGERLPYVAFVFWSVNKEAWVYCSEAYKDRPNFITTQPSGWSHILHPSTNALNAVAKLNLS